MKRLAALLTVAVLSISFLAMPVASAQDGGSDGAEGPVTYVRTVNLTGDAGSFDVHVNGEATDWTGLAYSDVSEWAALPAGTVDVNVMAAADMDDMSDDMSDDTSDDATDDNDMSDDASDDSSDDSADDAGDMAGDAMSEPQSFDFAADTWHTLLILGVNDDGTTMIVPVEENFQPLLPATTRITFVNALDSDTEVNFNRDGVPFVSQLAPLGTETGVLSTSTLELDSGAYEFTATATQNPDQVFGSLSEQDYIETTEYLMVVTGSDADSTLLLEATDRAEYRVLTGELEEPGTIIEAVQADERLTGFADAIEMAGMTEELSREGPYTVFAPLDSVLNDVMAEYENDPEGLADYLRARIVEGDMKSRAVFNAGSLTALNGESIEVTGANDTVYVNGAEVLAVNIAATNGTIHVIGATP